MNISETKRVTVPQLVFIAATRGMIGFGAGLLLADKFKSERRRVLGWSLFLSVSQHHSDCDKCIRTETNEHVTLTEADVEVHFVAVALRGHPFEILCTVRAKQGWPRRPTPTIIAPSLRGAYCRSL